MFPCLFSTRKLGLDIWIFLIFLPALFNCFEFAYLFNSLRLFFNLWWEVYFGLVASYLELRVGFRGFTRIWKQCGGHICWKLCQFRLLLIFFLTFYHNSRWCLDKEFIFLRRRSSLFLLQYVHRQDICTPIYLRIALCLYYLKTKFDEHLSIPLVLSYNHVLTFFVLHLIRRLICTESWLI